MAILMKKILGIICMLLSGIAFAFFAVACFIGFGMSGGSWIKYF